MSEPRAPQRAIPQYSLRWLLGLTVVCAGLCSVLALAARGHVWALAVSVGVGALAILLFVGAVLFILVWVGASIVGPRDRRGESPFAADAARRPQQIAEPIPPQPISPESGDARP